MIIKILEINYQEENAHHHIQMVGIYYQDQTCSSREKLVKSKFVEGILLIIEELIMLSMQFQHTALIWVPIWVMEVRLSMEDALSEFILSYY